MWFLPKTDCRAGSARAARGVRGGGQGPCVPDAHRRTAKGAWVKRAAAVAVAPSPEEQAAAAEVERALAQEARDAALRAALAAEADPLFFKWQREECRKEDWLDAVAAVKARYPNP